MKDFKEHQKGTGEWAAGSHENVISSNYRHRLGEESQSIFLDYVFHKPIKNTSSHQWKTYPYIYKNHTKPNIQDQKRNSHIVSKLRQKYKEWIKCIKSFKKKKSPQVQREIHHCNRWFQCGNFVSIEEPGGVHSKF